MENKETIFQNQIDYKKIFLRFLSFKKLFIVTILLFLIVAVCINKFSITTYRNSILILVDEKNKNSFLNSSDNVFKGANLFGGKANIENEMEIIRSFSIIKKVVTNLDFKTSVYYYNKTVVPDFLINSFLVKKHELYNNSPIKINVDASNPQANYLPFYVRFINDEEFEIEASGTNIAIYNYIDDEVINIIPDIYFKNVYRYGDEIKTKYFNFIINKTEFFNKDYTKEKVLYFHLNNINHLTGYYQTNFTTEPTSQASSIVKITLKGNHPVKIADFLNNFSSVFMERDLEKKNKIALSTVDFIDSQIENVADSLYVAESKLKTFRTDKGVMDLSFQGQQTFEKLNQLESEKANFLVQKKYYEYLANYFKDNTLVSDMPSPSSMNIVDPLLTNLISDMIRLNGERASLVKNNQSSQNIYLQDLNSQILNLKETIKENVNSSLNTLNISLNEINYRINRLSGQISQMPKTELQLKGIERKFQLNDAIYTYLLQKRSEAQIARASSMPDYEIIEPAKSFASSVVSPKTKFNYTLALILGIFLPSFYILIIDFMNNKISDIEEIQALTNRPVLGRVYRNFRRTTLVVAERPNSSVAESFRAIRTNFQFFNEGGKNQVILITSSTSGEGKSFCSINLASVLALNGNRVVLLEFDLRRPKIHQEFNSSNMIGITSYLIEKAILEDIIVPTGIENMDLISAGPAAPNPAELINSERTGEFIDKLKEMYDYIIIDSAPVGIVSETFLLMKHSDVNIFVTRIDYTIREALKNAIRNMKMNNFENYTVLINDLNVKRESYKYGYDNKYYTDDINKSFLGKLFSRKKKAS